MIEHIFAGLVCNRRLGKDSERLIGTSTAMLMVATVQLLVRRLATH